MAPIASARGFCLSLEFNLGTGDDYRVPDLGVHRGAPTGVWLPTAAVVVEVRSPGDDSLAKFAFYFDRGVEEILLADLAERSVRWFRRDEGAFVGSDASELLGVDALTVAAALGWQ